LRFFLFFFCRAFEQFKEAINDEDFEDLLKDAQVDPKGVAAQDLLKKLLPFLNISGRQVPWGNNERNAEVTKLMAEHRWYGPGSHFVNLAPGDVHNPSVVRLCHPFVGYDEAPAQVGDDDGPARVRGSGGDDGRGAVDPLRVRRRHGGAHWDLVLPRVRRSSSVVIVVVGIGIGAGCGEAART